MRLFIFNKCQVQVDTLPSAIRKKVYDFISKFQENSKSASIHLEPIKTFKDQTLRSARIDQTYRAIVKVSSHGDDFHFLWVDHHDKAYEWAQKKVVDYNKITNSWQVFTAAENITLEDDPKDIKKNQVLFTDYSKSELMNIGVPEILMPAIYALKDLDDLDQLAPHLPEGLFENLFYLHDGGSIDGVISEIREASQVNYPNSNQSLMDKRTFLEIPNDETLLEALSGDMLRWKHYLHESQALIVHKDYNGSFKLSGGAGTGKTVAALHRLKVLSKKDNLKGKVLFTTYTKALTSNLHSLAEAIDVKMSNVIIQNIDNIALDLGRKSNIIKQEIKFISPLEARVIWQEIINEDFIHYNIDFLEKELSEVILLNNVKTLTEYLRVQRTGRGKALGRIERKEVWRIIDLFNNKISQNGLLLREELFNLVSEHYFKNEQKPFAHIIVDELQDLSNVELRFIRSIVPKGENDIFMVGDPMQAIYHRNLNFTKAGIQIRGIRSKRLRINYRTTEEIRKLAISVVSNQDYDDFNGEMESKDGYISLMHGAKPTYEIFKNSEQELDFVISSIQNAIHKGYNLTDIVIASKRKKDLKLFLNSFHKLQLPYYEIHGEIKNLSLPGIRLSTFHSLKGLEFKLVYLINVDNKTLPFRPMDYNDWDENEKLINDKNESSLMYVAISRAVEQVTITGIGSPSHLLKNL